MIRIVRGDCLAAKDAGTRLVALARASNNDVLLINAHMHAQIACHHLGEFAEARDHSAAAVSLVPRMSCAERRIMMFDPVAASLAESSRNCWITGISRGRRPMPTLLSESDASCAIPIPWRSPWCFTGGCTASVGDWATCIASTEAGIATARESDSVQTLAWNRCVHGWGLAHAGRIEEGAAELLAGIDASTAIMGQVALPQFYAMMAEVLLLERDVEDARTWIQRATALMDANADLYFAAEVHRLAARCETEGSGAAIAHLRRAVDVARLQGAKLFELRAALDLIGVEPKEGKAAVAVALTDFPEPEPWTEIMRARQH